MYICQTSICILQEKWPSFLNDTFLIWVNIRKSVSGALIHKGMCFKYICLHLLNDQYNKNM